MFDPTIWQRQNLVATVFKAAISRHKLAHAYLLSGRCLEDKYLIAKQLACHLNCQAEDKDLQGSCAHRTGLFEKVEPLSKQNLCQNCTWIAEDAHPQAWIELSGSETKSGKIAVEKARLLADELMKTSEYFRVVVIPYAGEEFFHRPAANALLKTIEEPGKNTLFLLFADHWQEVLPTIVSRCQVLPINAFEGKEAQHAPIVKGQADLRNAYFAKGQEDTRQTLTSLFWSKEAFTSLDNEETDFATLIDAVVTDEVKALKDQAISNAHLSNYLAEVVKLADKTKLQVDHYVSVKAALESFALCLRQLREDFLGTPSWQGQKR